MEGASAGRRRLLAWAWLVLVPFAVHAWPYAYAEARGLAGDGVAALTVDEPVYVVHARSLVDGDPPETNPWTRERGGSASPYRRFPGSFLPLAAWMAAGGSVTVGLGLVAGACAAGCAVLAAFLLRRGGVAPGVATLLAPTVVLLPWNRIGGLVRGDLLDVDRNALLPLMRPFTSQMGPLLFLATAAAFAYAAVPGPRRRLVLPAVLVVALFHTFPYGVPVVLGAVAGWALWARATGRPAGRLAAALGLSAALLVPSALGYLALTPPQEGEVDPVRTGIGGIGKSTFVLLAVSALGLGLAGRRSGAPQRGVAPLLGLALALGMASSAALPFHLQLDNHLFYLYGPVLALVVLPWVAGALGRAPRAGAVAVVALAVASGVATTVACLRGARPELDDHARMVEVLRAAPTPENHLLLVEGAALNGWGGWAPLYTATPLLYAYDGEHAPTPSLEARQDRRAWYHYFLGLRSEAVPERTRESLYAYKRLAGALVYTARPEVFEAMADRIGQMERGEGPAVDRFRRWDGLVVVDSLDAPLFSTDRLAAHGTLVESRTVGRHTIARYARRGSP